LTGFSVLEHILEANLEVWSEAGLRLVWSWSGADSGVLELVWSWSGAGPGAGLELVWSWSGAGLEHILEVRSWSWHGLVRFWRFGTIWSEMAHMVRNGTFSLALRFPNNFWKNISARDAFPCFYVVSLLAIYIV
jgi:hypothetical protein